MLVEPNPENGQRELSPRRREPSMLTATPSPNTLRATVPPGDQKGTQCGRDIAQLCGCPRNCERRIFRHTSTGISVPGRRRQVTTRKSGDLPSAVVTREHVGRGVLAVDEPIVPRLWTCGETSFAVTCHRRATRGVSSCVSEPPLRGAATAASSFSSFALSSLRSRLRHQARSRGMDCRNGQSPAIFEYAR
jgi:hypothetical protein